MRDVEPLHLPDGIPEGWYVTRREDGWQLAKFDRDSPAEYEYEPITRPMMGPREPGIIRELRERYES